MGRAQGPSEKTEDGLQQLYKLGEGRGGAEEGEGEGGVGGHTSQTAVNRRNSVSSVVF